MGSLIHAATLKLWPHPDRVVLRRAGAPSWRTPAGSGFRRATPRVSRPSTSMRADDRTDRHDVGALSSQRANQEGTHHRLALVEVVRASASGDGRGRRSFYVAGCTRARSSSRSCPSPTTRRRLTLRSRGRSRPTEARRCRTARTVASGHSYRAQYNALRADALINADVQVVSPRPDVTAPTGIRSSASTASSGRRLAATATGIPGQQQRRRGGWGGAGVYGGAPRR